jgi:hypothetical protein
MLDNARSNEAVTQNNSNEYEKLGMASHHLYNDLSSTIHQAPSSPRDTNVPGYENTSSM